MFDLELTNCPEAFALNCKRYETHCHECKANSTGKYNKYLPIDKSIVPHPVDIEQKAKAKKSKGVTSYSRKGKSDERKLIENSWWLNKTYASGTIGGDGDAYIQLARFPKRIRVEIKFRYTRGGSLFPTKSEVREGLNQQINVWYICHKELGKYTVYLSFDFFIQLHTTILFSEKCVCNSDEYNNLAIEVFSLHDLVKYFFFSIKEHKCKTITPRGHSNKTSDVHIITNELGKFVTMRGQTFVEMLRLYQEVID